MKVMVIGHPESVLGFSLVGLQGQVATSSAEANQALDAALADPDIGILLITNEVAGLIGSQDEPIKVTQQYAAGRGNPGTGRRTSGSTFPG